MKVSISIEIIMQLAGQEAIAAQFKEIEPEHLLEAILKLSELAVEEIASIVQGADAARNMTLEINVLHEKLATKSIDSTKIRRKLREILGNGNSPYDGGYIHRSSSSRALFDAASKAADDAGSDTMTSIHMLEALLVSPTSVIDEVLQAEGLVVLKPPKCSNTPVLDEVGQDLVRLIASEPSANATEYKAVCKALIQALAQGHKKGLFLRSENEEAARSVVLAAARVLATKDCPKPLKGKRFIDISAINPDRCGKNEEGERLEKAIAEARAAKNVILYLPPLLKHKNTWCLDKLRSILIVGEIQFICWICDRSYIQVEKDPAWRKHAHVMRIHEEAYREFPSEV